MATTGWEKQMKKAKEIIEKAKVSMIYSSNFSIGMNIFFQLVSQSAEIINKYGDYDIFGWEMHHNRKLDSPSGTAKTIANLLLEKVQRKDKACYDKLDRKIAKNELHFSSMRAGDIAGIHSVGFDSLYDSIELKHTAKNRMGFAKGSLLAAKWILKQKAGFYSEKDLIKSILE